MKRNCINVNFNKGSCQLGNLKDFAISCRHEGGQGENREGGDGGGGQDLQ